MSELFPGKIILLIFAVATGTALYSTAAYTAAQTSQEAVSAAKPALDYEFFKTRVEPILVKRRVGHARCVLCHGRGLGAPQYLVKLAPGSSFWTEEQSRINFQNISKLVVPGKPMSSPFAI